MPKKPAPKKPVKKVTKTKETPVVTTSESTIESLPTPTADTQSAVMVEPTASSTPAPSVAPTSATVTPVSPAPLTPTTPATPTDIPTVVTEPDPTASVTTDSLTTPTGVSPLPQATPITDPLATAATTDDFEPEHKGKGMKILLIFLTALIVGGGAVAGFMYFSQNKQVSDEKKVATPTEAPTISTEEPVASESAGTVEVADLSVQILNGSGTAGEAARVRDLLQEAGFETFSLGNADSYDYTDTEVQVKKGLATGIYDKVEEALSTYTVVEKDALPETSDYDIVIFVGKHK